MYVLDSDVFINAKNRHYGFDIVPPPWEWLDQAHEAGRIFTVQACADEVMAVAEELADWMSTRRATMALVPGSDDAAALQAVSAWAVGEPQTGHRRARHDPARPCGQRGARTAISGQDDRDEMGVCLEPREYVTYVSQVPSRGSEEPASIPFDQYENHSVWEGYGGLVNRSGAGDLDVIIYGARKGVRLGLGGNPTVLLPLFVPEEIVVATDAGHELRANAHRIASRRAAERFLGYMVSQRRAMTGESGAHTNGPSWSSSSATTASSRCTPSASVSRARSNCRPVGSRCPSPSPTSWHSGRYGGASGTAVLEWTDRLEAELRVLSETAPLPDRPDLDWVNGWLPRSYSSFWSGEKTAGA